ncbi:MAG TPA: hypothetical protein VK054_12050, partial [Beutenbergiaceae bacterium]|nr:hypothetical protein [Beutenbergiaceae bacterium]
MSDAIVIGENWISEHFFATTGRQSFHARVLERRREWNAEEPNVRTRFVGARQHLVTLYARLADALAQGETGAIACAELYKQLLDVLGYHRIGLTHTTQGPLTRVGLVDMTTGGPLVIVQARPVEDVTELLARDGRTLFDPFDL